MHRPLLAGLAVLSIAGTARATPSFPDVMKSHLDLGTTPACGVCHTTGDVGGRGTVNTPFGTSLRARGLVAYDEGSLNTALDALDAERTDSDHDGVPDIDELREGRDPNVNDATGGSGPEPPAYGCGAQVSTARPDLGGVLPLWLVGAALLMRARRRRHR